MNFYERQRQNRRQTALLVLAFVLLFGALGAALDMQVTGYRFAPDQVPLVTLIALAVASTISLVSYFSGSSLVMLSLLAEPLDPEDPEHRQLHNIASEMAIASGLPMPKLYIIPDPAPNALATGRNPAHAAIAVTRGALDLLDREETQGVVAHEMAHIANRDTLVMTMIAILLGGIIMLADWGRRSLHFAREDRRRTSAAATILVVVLILLSPILSRLLAFAVSRQREYLADATAVEFTRNPEGLARALEKIASSHSPLRAATRGTAHLFIFNPLHRKSDEREGRLASLFSTHPPVARRIAILRGLRAG